LSGNAGRFLAEIAAELRQEIGAIKRMDSALVERDIAARRREAVLGRRWANMRTKVQQELERQGEYVLIWHQFWREGCRMFASVIASLNLPYRSHIASQRIGDYLPVPTVLVAAYQTRLVPTTLTIRANQWDSERVLVVKVSPIFGEHVHKLMCSSRCRASKFPHRSRWPRRGFQ
jgi:hypothetical protein